MSRATIGRPVRYERLRLPPRWPLTEAQRRMQYPPRQMTRAELDGWCIQFRVWICGYAGREVRPEHLLRALDCAVQYHQIYGRYWDRIGGLGHREPDYHRLGEWAESLRYTLIPDREGGAHHGS